VEEINSVDGRRGKKILGLSSIRNVYVVWIRKRYFIVQKTVAVRPVKNCNIVAGAWRCGS
jgi:hypothetical protein